MKYPYRKLKTSTNSLSIAYDKDKLKEVSSSQTTVSQLEIIKQGRIGTASITGTDESGLKERAESSADFGDSVTHTYVNEKIYPQVALYDPAVKRLMPQQLLTHCREFISAVKEINPEILVSLRISALVSENKIDNSAGLSETDTQSFLSVYGEGELVTEGDFLTIGDFAASRKETEVHWETLAHTISERFRLAKRLVTTSSGVYPVIFSPEVVSSLADIVSVALSAETVVKKVSRFARQEGKQVFDKHITMIDDPSIDFATGSTRFDDEGIAARPLTLVEKGVLKTFYTDFKNATILKIVSNGRGFGIPASPNLTNLVWEGGTTNLPDMISKIKKGIVVDQVIGAGQDSPYSGDFSFNCHLGYVIENGSIAGRIKNALIAGNVFDILKNQLGEISSQRKWIGSAFLPSILFEGVRVTVR